MDGRGRRLSRQAWRRRRRGEVWGSEAWGRRALRLGRRRRRTPPFLELPPGGGCQGQLPCVQAKRLRQLVRRRAARSAAESMDGRRVGVNAAVDEKLKGGQGLVRVAGGACSWGSVCP